MQELTDKKPSILPYTMLKCMFVFEVNLNILVSFYPTF